MLSNQTIEEVKNRIDIVEVVGDYVTLKKSGSSYKGLSPFTDEKTPSFFVSPPKEIFKCFSTGKGGDAISFVMEIEGIGYLEAIKQLAGKYGVEIIEEERTDEQAEAYNERESLYILLKFAADFFKEQLWESEEGQSIGYSYFKERGFTDDTIRKFDLGYAPNAWHALEEAAKKAGYSDEQLLSAGLTVAKEEKRYDRFRERVVFTIHNVGGKPIAFGARTLKSGAEAKKSPKYINSPETPVYHKSDVLYGIAQGKQSIRREDRVYLVEGYTDVISLHQAGVENVVASSGTSLTKEQIQLIKRFTSNVTVLYDGDAAGIKASLRGIDMLLEADINVRSVVFPDGEDPDSYSRKIGGAAFRDYLSASAKDFITFIAGLFAEEAASDPIRRAETIVEIVQSITKIPDPIKRSVYIKETARLLDVEETVLLAEMNKFLLRQRQDEEKKQRRDRFQQSQGYDPGMPYDPGYPDPDVGFIEDTLPVEPAPAKTDAIALQERESVRLLISYGSHEMDGETQYRLCDYLLEELADVQFQTPIYKEIFEEYKQQLQQGHVVDAQHFIRQGNEKVKQEITDMITERYQVSERWENQYQIYIPTEEQILKSVVYTNLLRLKFRMIQKMIRENQEDLKKAEEQEEQDKYLTIHVELKKTEMEIARVLGNVTAR